MQHSEAEQAKTAPSSRGGGGFCRRPKGKLIGALGGLVAVSGVLLGATVASAEIPPDPREAAIEGGARAARPAVEGVGSRHVLFVDADDDDDDGVADRELARVSSHALESLTWLSRDELDAGVRAPSAGPFRFVTPDGRPVPGGAVVPGSRVGLQGLRVGTGALRTRGGLAAVDVVEIRTLDAAERPIDMTRSHVSLARTLPTELSGQQEADAIRFLAIGPAQSLPRSLQVVSFDATGRQLDSVGPIAMSARACPPGTEPELHCRISQAVRASTDAVDRGHPAAAARSILAEVGGRIRAEAGGEPAASIRVGGPRGAAGIPSGRYRATVRAHVVRATPGGAPAVGVDEEQAIELLRSELRTASALWGQCGISFGPVEQLEIQVVDPPPTHLVAVGCDTGMPASGGTMRIEVEGRVFEVDTRPGELPVAAATRLAARVGQAGYQVRVRPNAPIARSAVRTADVVIRRANGAPANVTTPDSAPASNDPTLPVCLGAVDLADGLQHFTDFDAASGTVEERTLVRAYEDDDPGTVELVVIPAFAGTGRIGESFIFGPGTSTQNAVIIDRAGVRAGARSFTLAHELGHILLDMPGHPDDYGVDMPSALMDADAADATIFGPRRLSVEECARAVRQSGPKAPVPLLTEWPLYTASGF